MAKKEKVKMVLIVPMGLYQNLKDVIPATTFQWFMEKMISDVNYWEEQA